MARRQHGWRAAAALLLLLALPVRARAEAPRRPKLAVMEIRAQRVDPALASTLDAVVLSELSAGFDVIGKSDIVSMLGFEQQKQMLGCSEDASCLAEIGGALGVSSLVTGSLGKLGSLYLLTLNLHDSKRATVLRRVTEQVDKEEELVAAVQRAVRRLMLDPAAPVEPAAPKGPGFGTLRLAGLGASAALVGVGAFFGVRALDTRDELKSALEKPDPYGRDLATTNGLRTLYSHQAWAADGFLAGGVAAAVASWFLLAPAGPAGAGGEAPSVAALPDPAHAGLLVTGSF